jgi:acyl carrier protein
LQNEYIAPRDDTEEIIASIWQQCLGIDKVGIHDNLHELGGDSLIAIRIIARVRAVFGLEIPLGRFFQSPTVAQLGHMIADTLQSGSLDAASTTISRKGLEEVKV